MEKTYCSIFNDVLGPIMTGPSSSHSAGCARIGKTARSLFGREIYHADIVFEEKGSYPSTYIGQGSNFGFTGGLLGYETDDPRLKDAVEIAKTEGRKITSKKASLGFHHPNEAQIRIYGESEAPEMTLLTYSIGGGMFQITEMDGFPVLIDGGCLQIFIACQSLEALEKAKALLHAQAFPYTTAIGTSGTLLTVKPPFGAETSSLKSLLTESGIAYVRFAEPVMSVVRKAEGTPPFSNAAEALEYQQRTGASLYELAIAYEQGYGHVSEDMVWTLVGRVAEAMERSTVPPDPETTPVTGFLPYSCRKMEATLPQRKTADTGLLRKAMLAAIAVMENSCAHRIVVASPTAGSSGVVPAAVVCIGRQLGASDREIREALLASGLIGVFIANQATFGGEVGACQAENGSASAMAAAGVVHLLGGSMKEAFQAAGMALQNMLGLICDPVAGLTEIPCISRNVSAMANAVFSANMAIAGFDPIIPLDETICTMGRVGEQLPAGLRCTCEGGLCVTPTGCRLQEEIDRQRPKL